ncbi:MAG: hypothetical protein ACOCWG_03570 [bacterium]
MSVKANLKIILKADDTIVAESDDPILWQKILISINSNNDQIEEFSDTNNKESKELYSNDDLIKSFANYLEIPIENVNAAISPTIEAPYIHIDKHYWEAIKKSLPARGATAIADVVIAGTILLVWKEYSKLGDTLTKDVTKILSDLNITAKNPTRSFQNSEWLQLRNNKLFINPVETSKAKNFVKSFCLKQDPYKEG